MNRTAAILLVLLAVLVLIGPASAAVADSGEARALLAEGILGYLRGGERTNPGLESLREAVALYPAYPRRFVDSAGTEFVFYRPPGRVVAMNSDAADAITVIGAEDLIVGVGEVVTTSPLRFPHLAGLPNVGKYNEPDIEAILAARPDLIVTYVSWPDSDKLERHLPARIAVVRMDLYRAETFRSEMEIVGRLFGREGDAAAYLSWYDRIYALVDERVGTIPPEERTRVYVDYGGGKSAGRRTMSEGTGMHDLLVAAGGVNVAAGHVTGYADVESEWVIRQRPDVVMIWSPGGGYTTDGRDLQHAAREDVMAMPGFHRIPAIEDGRVYVIASSYAFGSSSPAALVRVASWLYPDRFADIDPDEIHREYLETFTRTDEEIRETGTFFYPMRESR